MERQVTASLCAWAVVIGSISVVELASAKVAVDGLYGTSVTVLDGELACRFARKDIFIFDDYASRITEDSSAGTIASEMRIDRLLGGDDASDLDNLEPELF